MSLDTLIILALVPVAVLYNTARLEWNGMSGRLARRTVFGLTVNALIAALPFAFLSRAFGGSWREAAMVFDVAVVAVLFVGSVFAELRRSFAGQAGDEQVRLVTLAWNIGVVVVVFALGFEVVAPFPDARPMPFPDALYLSTMTLTTVGYGDVTPAMAARPLAMLEALVGYALLGAWVATLVHRVTTGTVMAEADHKTPTPTGSSATSPTDDHKSEPTSAGVIVAAMPENPTPAASGARVG